MTCKILKEKPEQEIHAFANDFVRTLFYNQQTEKNELKGFLLGLLEQDTDVQLVDSQQKDWGELIQQRSTPWAKRLQLLGEHPELLPSGRGGYLGLRTHWL